jgi:hypothetical protein
MDSLPTEISKIIYKQYVRARNEMIKTSLTSYIKELTISIVKGDIPEKYNYSIPGVVIDVMWFKRSEGKVDIMKEHFFSHELEMAKAKYKDIVRIDRKCVIAINGYYFGLDFLSDINFNKNPDSNHRHSWLYWFFTDRESVSDRAAVPNSKEQFILDAMKMAMVEFHADTCDTPHQSSYEVLERSGGFSIGTCKYNPLEDETVEVSRSKVAFVDGETTEYCRQRRDFECPRKLRQRIMNIYRHM